MWPSALMVTANCHCGPTGTAIGDCAQAWDVCKSCMCGQHGPAESKKSAFRARMLFLGFELRGPPPPATNPTARLSETLFFWSTKKQAVGQFWPQKDTKKDKGPKKCTPVYTFITKGYLIVILQKVYTRVHKIWRAMWHSVGTKSQGKANKLAHWKPKLQSCSISLDNSSLCAHKHEVELAWTPLQCQ